MIYYSLLSGSVGVDTSPVTVGRRCRLPRPCFRQHHRASSLPDGTSWQNADGICLQILFSS